MRLFFEILTDYPFCWSYSSAQRCHKYWNNNDECYYVPERDDKDAMDWCDDYEKDFDIKWEDVFGDDDP